MRFVLLCIALSSCQLFWPLETLRLWEGIEALEEGDPEAALEAFDRADAPPHPALSLDRALALHQLGDDRSALTAFDEAIALAKDRAFRARLFADRGTVRAKAGRTTEAIDDLRQALRLDPADERARRNLEVLLFVEQTSDERDDDESFSIEQLWEQESRDLAVVTIAPDPQEHRLDAYWRQTTFDVFDGRRWWARGEWVPEADRPSPDFRPTSRQAFTLAPGMRLKRPFGLDHPRFFSAPEPLERRDWDVRGDVREWVAESDDRVLLDPSSPRWRQLPSRLDPRIPALAARLVGSTSDPLTASRAVERFLVEHHRYSRATHEPSLDPLAAFLFSAKSGDCRLFSTALVVLLRARGFEARVVGGLHGGTRVGRGRYLLTEQEGHAWAEVRDSNGWFRMDPTPPAEAPLSQPEAEKLFDTVGAKPARVFAPTPKPGVKDW